MLSKAAKKAAYTSEWNRPGLISVLMSQFAMTCMESPEWCRSDLSRVSCGVSTTKDTD